MRKGITANPRENALATSRRTCSESFAFSENTRTNTRQESMAHNPVGPVGTKRNVARSNPTANASRLQVIADRIRCQLVFTGMADKDLRCHDLTTIGEGAFKCMAHRIRCLARYLRPMPVLIIQVGFAFLFIFRSFMGTVTKRLVR